MRFKAAIFLLLVVILGTGLTACAGNSKTTISEEAHFLVGEWTGEAWIEEVWTFKEDGSGHNENSLLPYDFDFEYADNKLDIYSYFGSMKSDEPTTYEVEIVSDNEIHLTDGESEYVLTK